MVKEVFTGALLAGWLHVTAPLVRLTVAEDGLAVRVLGIVHTRARWEEVATAEWVVDGLTGSPGVRIALRGRRAYLTNEEARKLSQYDQGLLGIDSQFVFWNLEPDKLLTALKSRGVSIVDSGGRPSKVWLKA